LLAAAHPANAQEKGKPAQSQPAPAGGRRRLNFDKDAAGKLPPMDGKPRGTNQKVASPRPAEVAGATRPRLRETQCVGAEQDQSRFRPTPSNIMHGPTSGGVKDGTIETLLKPISGKEDQGGGHDLAEKDANNLMYICRANPLESNFRLYYVQRRRAQATGPTPKSDIANRQMAHYQSIVHAATTSSAWFDGKETAGKRATGHLPDGRGVSGSGPNPNAVTSRFDLLRQPEGHAGNGPKSNHDEKAKDAWKDKSKDKR